MKLAHSDKIYKTAVVITFLALCFLVFIIFSTWMNLETNRKTALEFYKDNSATVLGMIERMSHNYGISDEKEFFNLLASLEKSENIDFFRAYNKDFEKIYPENSLYPDKISSKKSLSPGLRKKEGGTCFESGKELQLFGNNKVYLILGSDMEKYESARSADIKHAFIMVFIVAALAAASVFFLFVIRSYRLMNIRLKRANEYTQNVVENMAEGLITVNSLGDIISYNNKGLDLLGLDSSSNIVSDSGWFEGRVEKTINSGESVQGYEFVYPGEEGEVNILADVTPLREPGSSNYGAVIIIRDMTRIKRLEREIARNEKLAATGRLAAMVAHEIRNPLSSIKGFGMFFASLFSDDEQKKEYAMLIASEVDRINIVVTDLLTYSRKMDIKPEFTDIEFLFDETLGLLQFEIEKKKIKVSKNISKSMPRIKLDKERMKQVFLNLMINAVEMMDENGEIEVGADLHKNRDKSVIWISDTGPGIEMEKQKEIFDLFFTTRKKGTGLGLAIVQKIIEYHDGSIEVESPVKNGRGTMFKINLPVHPD